MPSRKKEGACKILLMLGHCGTGQEGILPCESRNGPCLCLRAGMGRGDEVRISWEGGQQCTTEPKKNLPGIVLLLGVVSFPVTAQEKQALRTHGRYFRKQPRTSSGLDRLLCWPVGFIFLSLLPSCFCFRLLQLLG